MTPQNRWKLIQEVLDPNSTTEVKGNQSYAIEYIANIKKKFPHLTIDLIQQFAKEKRSGAELCREFKINPNAFVAFCKFHQVSCGFTQCSPEVKAKLDSKEVLEDLIKGKNSESLANELGVSPSLILQKLHQHGIEWDTNKGRSSVEIEVADFIKSIYSGEVIENTRSVIPPKEIDVFIPELKIGFELNGIYHHSFQEKRHNEKFKLCKDVGVRLIQITDHDWKFKKGLIQRKVKHILGCNTYTEKVFARNCTIAKSTNIEVRNFVNDNHIYGHKNCQHCYKAEFEGKIVAVMTFTKNHLERFCSSTSVVGGFSKLFKFAVADLNLTEVVTFADLSWSDLTNNVYVINGFELDKINNPNYWWIKGSQKLSRQKCQKHKLGKMKTFDPNKTESEIMREAGYHKYYDAGHAKFKWKHP